MPKVRTKKIVAKRFKISKGGKIIHRSQGRRHLRKNKSASQKRRQDKPQTLTNRKSITMIKRFLQT